jgi:MFS family permease
MAYRLARAALATPDLRRLQLAWAAAAIGGWAFMVTLAVHAYDVGGVAAVGLAALVRMVPAGLAAPLIGMVADRFPRRDVLLVSAAARVLLLVAAACAVAAPFALLLVIAALFTVAQAAHKPAQAALLPHLAPDHDRQAAANAVWSGIDNAAFIGGAIAGGVVVAALGVAAAFATAAFTFVLAAALLARIERDRRPKRSTAAGLSVTGETLAGVRVVARDPKLRVLVGVLSASTLVEGMIDVLVVITALRVVDLGDAGVGWLNAAWGVGGLAGGAVALSLVARGRLRLALPAGALLIGLPLLALAALRLAIAALGLLVLLGVGYSLIEVAGLTLLQRLADDSVRARAFAVVESSYWLTTGLGAMLAPLIVALAGPRGALAVVGAALPLVVLARWASVTRLSSVRPPLLRPEPSHA